MRRPAIGILLTAPLALSMYVLAAGCTTTKDGETVQGDAAACGNIDVSAEASCTVEVSGGCEVNCTPVKFEAACYAECEGGCDVNIDVGCTGECYAGCEGECDINPGSFDCQGECYASCTGGCSGRCSAAANSAECHAACEGTCEGDCNISCEATPPSATCQGKCEAKCEGECHADASMDCQVDCQGGCYADLQGGCEAQCQSPDGALFCDGQYVDTGDNLAKCIAYLDGVLSVDVETAGSAVCTGNSCTAEGSVSCASVAPRPVSDGLSWLAAGLGALGLAALRRRRHT